jgi:PiT family inorganic phosphate transporter
MNNLLKTVIGALFAVAVGYFASTLIQGVAHGGFLVMAAVFGAYMAMNIGANDVANNVGPAVGSGALSMTGAIVLAAIFEAGGALIAGGDVVGTIKKGIIAPTAFGNDPIVFVYAMSAALLAAALWLNLATWFKAPVSTTHSIVGGVVGAGIAAGGFGIVAWGTMGKIVASWVISPVLGGVIAAGFLYTIKKTILSKEDMRSAAKRVVPILIAIMTAAFVTYLTLKGLKHIWQEIAHNFTFLPQTKKPPFSVASVFGLIGGVIAYLWLRPRIARKVEHADNTRKAINGLFAVPLVFSAALLSFAHGANDVANAVGPLAAVNDALTHLAISKKAAIPLWVMATGGLGIAIGLALFGPRLIRTVGSEITELDAMRAFSIMLAAAITVIIASQLGLPVSSTHIAVGAVFGVGFLREWLDSQHMKDRQAELYAAVEKYDAIKAELKACPDSEAERKLDLINRKTAQKKVVKKIKKKLRENYIKKGMIKKIVTAWVITVPVAAILSAIIFFVIKGVGLS